MNEQTTDSIINFIEFFEKSPDMSKVFMIASDVMAIANNLKICTSEGAFKDIKKFCKKDPENCSSTTIMNNLTKNMFVIFGKVTEMAEIFKAFPATETEDFYAQTYSIGGDIGTLVRVLLAYQAW